MDLGGETVSANRPLPSDDQVFGRADTFRVGDFLLEFATWSGAPALGATHASEPDRVLWASVAGLAPRACRLPVGPPSPPAPLAVAPRRPPAPPPAAPATASSANRAPPRPPLPRPRPARPPPPRRPRRAHARQGSAPQAQPRD